MKYCENCEKNTEDTAKTQTAAWGNKNTIIICKACGNLKKTEKKIGFGGYEK